MFFELGIEQRKRAEEIYHKMLIQTSERMKKEVNTDKLFVSPKPVRKFNINLHEYFYKLSLQIIRICKRYMQIEFKSVHSLLNFVRFF